MNNIDSLDRNLVDEDETRVDSATQNPKRLLLYHTALQYIALRKLLGVKVPTLDEAYLDLDQRFPDKESYERFFRPARPDQIFHQEAGQDETAVRLSLLPEDGTEEGLPGA